MTFLSQGLCGAFFVLSKSLQLLTAVIEMFWLEEGFNHGSNIWLHTQTIHTQRCEELLPIPLKPGSKGYQS